VKSDLTGDEAKRRWDELKALKRYHVPMYQEIANRLFGREGNIDSENAGAGYGVCTVEKYLDSVAGKSNTLMSSALVGMVFPNASRTFKIEPPYYFGTLSDEEKDFFANATQVLTRFMDDPKVGLMTAVEEFMRDQGAYGTSGIGIFERDEADYGVPFTVRSYDVKRSCIAENADGFVDTVYTMYQYSVKQAVEEFGIDEVSAQTRKAYQDNKLDDMVNVLHCIQPRKVRDIKSNKNSDLPILSNYYEYPSRKTLRKSGFDEMPIFVGRFIKNAGDMYGDSPARIAIADIREAFVLREGTRTALAQNLNPTLMVEAQAVQGNKSLNITEGGTIYFNRQPGFSGDPVKPIHVTGSVAEAYQWLQDIQLKVREAFYLDLLLDLNNTSRQTLGEAVIRDRQQNQALGPLTFRMEAEVFSPLIQRAFNILFAKGYFGVLEGEESPSKVRNARQRTVPKRCVEAIMGQDSIYEIQYVSPAMRVRHAEELNAVTQEMQQVLMLAQAKPEVLDLYNFDAVLKKVNDLCGSNSSFLNDDSVVKDIRAKREQATQQQMAMQADQINAMALKDKAKAGKDVAGALEQGAA
jgi:hypothetical protein